MLKICVIGAGAAGLCAARHLLRRQELLVGGGGGAPAASVTVFEAGEAVGGTWIYSDEFGDGVHSSMYRDLKTNLPKEVMAFPDFPFR